MNYTEKKPHPSTAQTKNEILVWIFIKFWARRVWLPVTVIVYRKQELDSEFSSKSLLKLLWVISSSMWPAVSHCSCPWFELTTNYCSKHIDGDFFFLNLTFWLSCLLIATLIKPPLGRILARPCSRWTRRPRPVLCQCSNRILWTQRVVCIRWLCYIQVCYRSSILY